MENNFYKKINVKALMLKEFLLDCSQIYRPNSSRLLKEVNRLVYNINSVTNRHKTYVSPYIDDLKYEFNESIFDSEYVLQLKNKHIENIPTTPKDEYISMVKVYNNIEKDINLLITSFNKLYTKVLKYKEQIVFAFNDSGIKTKLEKELNKIKPDNL